MIAIWRHTPFIGQLRYLLFDLYANLTLRIGLGILCIATTLLSALLLRDIQLTSLTSIIKGFVVILGMIGLTGAIIIYQNLATTGIVIVVISTILHEGVQTGTGTKITFTFILLCVWIGLWLFKMVVVDRTISIRPSPANIPIYAFIAIVLFSFLWSNIYVEEGVHYLYRDKIIPRVMTALTLIISPITYLIYGNLFHQRKLLRFFIWWFIGVGALFGLIQLASINANLPFNANGQFPIFVAALALGQAMFNPSLKVYTRVLLLGIAVIWSYLSIGLGISWLSGWIPLVLVMFILIFFYSRKFLIGLGVIVLIYLALNFSTIQTIITGEQEESGQTRADSWRRTFAVVEDHYLFGTGPAGYHFYFTAYGYYDAAGIGTFNLSHNNYVDILAQTGIFGFATFIFLFIGHGITVWKLYRTSVDDPLLNGLKYALIAIYPMTLITMMLGDWITPFPYTQTLSGIDYTIWHWIFAGITLALYHYLQDQNQKQINHQLPIVNNPPLPAVPTE